MIAQQVEDAMLGNRHSLDTAQAEKEADAPRRLLKIERDLRDQITKLHDQLQQSRRELHITPENLQAVVEIALELAGQPGLKEASLQGRGKTNGVFRMPALRGSWAQCSEGLRHPHSGEQRPITFDHALALGTDDVVLVHLHHRLAQMAMRMLRAEVWSTEGRKQLHRVTARLVDDRVLDTPAVIAFGRIVVLGGDNHRLHEEIIQAGGTLTDGRFRRMNVTQVAESLAAALHEPAPPQLADGFRKLWPRIEQSVNQSLALIGQ